MHTHNSKIDFMNSKFLLLFTLATCLMSLAHGSATVEMPSHIVGSVVNVNGKPVSGIVVQLKNKGITAVTDASGNYQLNIFDSGNKIVSEDFFNVEGPRFAFHVLTLHAHVKITVFDFAGHELEQVLDENLARGLYGLSPLAGLRHSLKAGIYGVRLEIGERSYYHRIPYIGKKLGRIGVRFVPLSLESIAKVAATEVDTLVIFKLGYRTVRQPVLLEEDSLPGMVLIPDSLTSWRSDDRAYLKAIDPSVTITPLLTVGESVPLTGNPLQAFRMGGFPAGLGLTPSDSMTARLFMSHDINSKNLSDAFITGPARRGAYVSEYLLDKATGRVLSGRYAFESAYKISDISPTPGFFSGFGSGFLAGAAEGISTPFYLTSEASTDSLAFSPLGPQPVAIVGERAQILPDFGKLSFSDIVVVPNEDSMRTVTFLLGKGPANAGQLYLYVGRKLRDLRTPDPIYENGLAGGKLYVFAAQSKHDEAGFTRGALEGHWVDPLKNRPDAPTSLTSISAATLQAWCAVSADGKDKAFRFDHIENGTYDPSSKGVFYFATAGDPGGSRNRFGRIYKLTYDSVNPADGYGPRLEILASGDPTSGFANPGDIRIGSTRKMMICEKPLLESARIPAVWMLDLETKGLRKLAEMDPYAVPIASRPDSKTQWEATGIIDASAQLGAGEWLLNVQAHSVGSESAAEMQDSPKSTRLIQGGQLLLLHTAP